MMFSVRVNWFFLLISAGLLFHFCSFPERKRAVQKPPILVERPRPLPKIKLTETQDRQFVFTNKKAGFYLGHTHRYNESSFEGWTVNQIHLLKDYHLLQNGHALNREKLKAFVLHPYGFERFYANKTREFFVLLDSVDVILILVEAPKKAKISLRLPDFAQTVSEQKAQLSIHRPLFGSYHLNVRYFNNKQGKHYFVLSWNEFSITDSLKAEDIERLNQAVEQRKKRFERLLQHFPFFIPQQKVLQALQWAIFSMDALVVDENGPGIWAGLPWFNDYWGRDTFIALKGALLVRGHFITARKILRNFARFQLKDTQQLWAGRIPNRITNKETIYNTADGTWWFIRALYDYYLFTADSSFVQEMFPVVRFALQQALQKRTDDLGFLLHDEAETWMDAVGPKGAWSPRGNRAVEVQALWYTALQIGLRLAEVVGAEPASVQSWQKTAQHLRQNFNRYFWNESAQALFDHLNADGSPDSQIRPNQILAVTVPDLPGIQPLLPKERQQQVAHFVTENLSTPQGVLSLGFKEQNFHPYHHFLPYYVPDAAYHNGLIWVWLTGPVVSAQALFNQSVAMETLLTHEVEQITAFDALGSLSELVEPVLRKGETQQRISGTVSQAWSLAELLRNFYCDLVGYQPIAAQNRVLFRPHLISGIEEIRCRVPFKNNYLDVHLQRTPTGMKFRLHSNFPHQKIEGRVQFPQEGVEAKIFLPDSGRDFEYEFIRSDTTADSLKRNNLWHLAQIDSGASFATIHQIPFKLLSGQQVFFPIGQNGPTVVYKRDDLNDDQGPNGKYKYPLNPLFEEGIADLKSLTIYDNDSTWGFRIDLRHLVDPGWHPEYGFQLTFLAIALADEQLGPPYATPIAHQAHFKLKATRAFNRVIYVGGGLEICDAHNQRKALFVPLDLEHPLGFVKQKQIRFQVPKTLLPGLNAQTKITVLCGLQDDHGGSGLGDFRAVLQKADYWHGGGADRPEAPAVYDWLEVH